MRAALAIVMLTFTLGLASQSIHGQMQAGDLETIHMVDRENGWAMTDRYMLLRTTDGGNHWRDVTPLDLSGQRIGVQRITALSSDIAWVIPVAISGHTRIEIFRTSDGGRSWKGAAISAPSVTSISFINPREGWLMAFLVATLGNNEDVDIYRSTDGGETWTKLASTTREDESGRLPTQGTKLGVMFLNSTTGWVTGTTIRSNSQYLYVTHDNGRTWRHQALSLPPRLTPRWEARVEPPKFFTGQDGMLPVYYYLLNDSQNQIGMVVVFYFTHDRGMTWTYTRPAPISHAEARSLLPSSFADMNHGWLKEEEALHATVDGGRQWTIMRSQLLADVTQIDFTSPSVGWAIRGTSPRLLKTLDGGRTWTTVTYTVSRQ